MNCYYFKLVRTPRPHGFSLIELLVTSAVIAVLAGILLPAIVRSKETARKMNCRNNLRQMILGATMYSNDDRDGSLSSSFHDTNDVLTFLYPHYVNTTRTFECPSTKNVVRPDRLMTNSIEDRIELVDLTGYAGNTKNPGTSYELFGFMNYTKDTRNYSILRFAGGWIRVPGIRKTISSVNAYQHVNPAFGLQGTVPGPSAIWLILDGDEPPGYQNFPDKNNNHGEQGGNVAFCDGHVDWIPSKKYVQAYELSQDENRNRP